MCPNKIYEVAHFDVPKDFEYKFIYLYLLWVSILGFGYTTHNEECHLTFYLFHPNLKLSIAKYFPLKKGGPIIPNVLATS